jgi:hypothetical protein
MYLLGDFLVLCVMIPYHIMIPLLPLSLLVVTSHQIFANMDTSYDILIVTSLTPNLLGYLRTKVLLNNTKT